MRLLREFIEVTEYGNDIFEDTVELDVSAIVWSLDFTGRVELLTR